MDKHSMPKTKKLFHEKHFDIISPDSTNVNWKSMFFSLLDAIRSDFDYIEDDELKKEGGSMLRMSASKNMG